MIEFRPFQEDDLPLLRAWLERDHVRRWWREPIEHELSEDPSGRFVIVVDGRKARMIQSYDGEVDLLIGEEDMIGQGLGPEVISRFASEIPKRDVLVATVEEGNRRSWRAFEKAGFRHVHDVEEDGRPHRLMRLDRS